jgi:hypothetical protein
MINDGRGTGRKPNVEVGGDGMLKAIRVVPALNPGASPTVRMRSEFHYSYGEAYWEAMADAERDAKAARAARRRAVGRDARAAARRGELVAIE